MLDGMEHPPDFVFEAVGEVWRGDVQDVHGQADCSLPKGQGVGGSGDA